MLKLKKKRVLMLLVITVMLVGGVWFLLKDASDKKSEIKMKNFVNQSLEEVKDYIKEEDLELEIIYEYNNTMEKDTIITQSIKKGAIIKSKDKLIITVSKGPLPIEEYKKNAIDELGSVPIMMYHGIENKKNSDTKYIGGNVDKDGYNRTTEAFRKDLEFYYQNGYRMISLNDYVDGNIDVEFGKTPIILTFDDGKVDNFKVLSKKGDKLEIDPNCAIGILEEFKEKYPDFNVTATFFVNEELFGQEEYNEDILKWLAKNGYDVGNHTLNHSDFTKISEEKSHEEVGGLYQILDNIIPNDYVNIVALPFGSPYKTTHKNYQAILNSNYNSKNYKTKAALRVGWEAELSPFNIKFNSTFLKRIRAYDNNGEDFDIEMNFKLLEKKRYISDGDKSTIVIPKDKEQELIKTDKKIITYEA